MFGKGISKEGDVLDLAADRGIVVKSGAWYAYKGEKIGQGRENAKIYLQEHADVYKEIENRVRIEAGVGGVSEEEYQRLVAEGLVEPKEADEE